MTAKPASITPAKALARGGLFSATWLVIAGVDAASWIIGAPAVLAATWANLRLSQSHRQALSLQGLVRFAPYFLWESLRGGLDIASRVISPRLPIDPGIRDYQMRLASPSARIVFLDCISLIPGTLSADLRGDRVRVHTLDVASDIEPSLAALERRVAAVFGERLDLSRTSAARIAAHQPGPETTG